MLVIKGLGQFCHRSMMMAWNMWLQYASRVLSKAERRYSATRMEMLAVVSFLHHFRPYLLGRRFTLRTDHGSLLWLKSFKEPEGWSS